MIAPAAAIGPPTTAPMPVADSAPPAIIRPPPRAPAPPVIALKVSPLWMPSIICAPPKKTSATGRALPRNGAALPRNGAASPTHFAASSAHPKNLVFPIPVGMPMAFATSSASPLYSEPTLKMFLWIALSYIQDPATNSKRSSALPRNRVKSRTSPVSSRIFLPLFHRPWNAFQTLPPSVTCSQNDFPYPEVSPPPPPPPPPPPALPLPPAPPSEPSGPDASSCSSACLSVSPA